MMSFGSKALIVGSFVVLVIFFLGLVGMFSAWEETSEAERNRLEEEVSALRAEANSLEEVRERLSKEAESTRRTHKAQLRELRRELTSIKHNNQIAVDRLKNNVSDIKKLNGEIQRLSSHLEKEKKKRQECRKAISVARDTQILVASSISNLTQDKLNEMFAACLD